MKVLFSLILCTVFSKHIFVTGFAGNDKKLCNFDLPRTESSFTYKELKIIMYMSLCKPLRDLPRQYLLGLQNPDNVKILILKEVHSSLDLLASGSGEFTYYEDGVKLEMDSPCTESSSKNLNYSVVISFKCSQEENEPIFEYFSGERCSFVFKWQAPFVCILSHRNRSENCLLTIDKKSIDLTSLSHQSHYTVQGGNYKMYINFCGPVNLKDCQSSGAFISGCIINKNQTYLMENKLREVTFSEERLNIEVKFYMIQGVMVIVSLQCKHDAFAIQPSMKYLKKPRRLLTTIETSVVCLNDDRCDINFGNERFSLPRGSNVMVKHANGIFLLNACGPLKSDSFWIGGETSASLINGTVMSLGSMRSLTRTNTGDLILTLTKGSFCPGTKHRAKTVIRFICSETETAPAFLDTSEKCIFTFQWKGPSFCPVLEARGRGCEVRDPNVGMEYRLGDDSDDSAGSNPQNEFEISHNGLQFQLNLCGKVKKSCNSETDVGVCLSTNHKEIVLGRRSSMTYSFKQGSLVFELRGSECVPNVTSRVIVNVLCEFGASDRFVSVLNDSDSNCASRFIWYTKKICPKEEPLSCTVKNQNGSVVNLNSLRLLSSNYRVPKDNDSYFLLNVCGPLWYGPDETCPPSSAACLVKKEKFFYSIGEIYSNLTLSDQGDVILTYKNVNFLPPWETVITFVCDEKNEGPKYIGAGDWKQSFRWKTRLACFNKTESDGVKLKPDEIIRKQVVIKEEKAEMGSEAPVDLNASISKGVVDARFEHVTPSPKSEEKEVSCIVSEGSVDLSVLEPIYVSTSKCARLFVDVCKGASCLSFNSSESSGLDFRISRSFFDDRGFVTVDYYNDILCDDHSNKSLSLIFVCDKSQRKGSPRLANQTSCSSSFLWNTRVVCPSDFLVLDKSNQNFINKSSNQVVALESSLKKPIRIELGPEIFYVNLLSSNVPGDEVPCSGNICEKKNNTLISHGTLNNVIWYDYNHNRIVMEFEGGDVCKGTRRYSSRIYLNCSDDEISTPKSQDWAVSRHYCELILELVTPCFEVKPINRSHATIIFLSVSAVLLVLFSIGFGFYYNWKKTVKHSSSDMMLLHKEGKKLFDKEL